MSLKCKYCEKQIKDTAYYIRTDNNETNCESCEIICRITVDMLSSGIHSIGIFQPKRSKREDSRICCETRQKLKYIFQEDRMLVDVKKYVDAWKADYEMRCSEHCGNTVREVQ